MKTLNKQIKVLTEEIVKSCKSNQVDWIDISSNYTLPEEFIEKFQDKIDWIYISHYQKLSEEFIEKFQHKVYWDCISIDQKLSEEFIEKFQDEVDWDSISMYQKLSEEFIEKFQDEVDWYCITRYQKLSESFISKHELKIPEDSWMYKDKEWKKEYIRNHTDYEIVDDKIIAYKSCRSDGYSIYNFQYHYEVGNEYESHADYNPTNENSFGLSAWTKEGALSYCSDGKLFKVEIAIEDVACIVHNGNKIRCSKLRIVEEVT